MGAGGMSGFQTNSRVIKWIEHRMPVFSFLDHAVGSGYPAPKNLSYMWNFGSLAGMTLVIMIVTGILLAMQYTAHVDYAFDSISEEHTYALQSLMRTSYAVLCL